MSHIQELVLQQRTEGPSAVATYFPQQAGVESLWVEVGSSPYPKARHTLMLTTKGQSPNSQYSRPRLNLQHPVAELKNVDTPVGYAGDMRIARTNKADLSLTLHEAATPTEKVELLRQLFVMIGGVLVAAGAGDLPPVPTEIPVGSEILYASIFDGLRPI
jgi:hypothetical protein